MDASPAEQEYVFRYTRGALRARDIAGFVPLISFPRFDQRYESSELFPLFKNRVLDPARKDFVEYLNWLSLDPSKADPIEILSLTGGERQTDSLEVFPKVNRLPDGTFSCRFFLHGLRHVTTAAQERAKMLEVGERLQVAIEVNNPATRQAVQLQSRDCHLLGWAPRYLVSDLCKAISEQSAVDAIVTKINQINAPLARRILSCACNSGTTLMRRVSLEEVGLVAPDRLTSLEVGKGKTVDFPLLGNQSSERP
ncbi:MAG: HIRAN domain-containing protein [Betaproteobacteria bacterium]|nr:HIRAN domain-containing protein [Betaproteobacteria bacterium]